MMYVMINGCFVTVLYIDIKIRDVWRSGGAGIKELGVRSRLAAGTRFEWWLSCLVSVVVWVG